MLSVVKLPRLTPFEIAALGETLDGYEQYFINEIASGACELWNINNDDSFCITRLETDKYKANHITLVVCCYKGKDLNLFVDHITEIADNEKWSIRFHTLRPGLIRWMKKDYNFNETEYIAMRTPNDG